MLAKNAIHIKQIMLPLDHFLDQIKPGAKRANLNILKWQRKI